MVPADYDLVIFADLEAILQDPTLKEALEEQGILALLGPLSGTIQDRADTMVLASDGAVMLGVIRGNLEAAALIASLGVPRSETEPESYGQFELHKLDVDLPFLKLNLAVSFVDDTTAVFSLRLSSESSSVDVLKAALDVLNGSRPSLLSDPLVNQLVRNTPQGIATTVAKDCTPLVGIASQNVIEGYLGLTASSVPVDGDDVAIIWAVGFSSRAAALAALPGIEEQVAKLGGDSLSGGIEGSVDGQTVRVRALVEASDALAGVVGLIGP